MPSTPLFPILIQASLPHSLVEDLTSVALHNTSLSRFLSSATKPSSSLSPPALLGSARNILRRTLTLAWGPHRMPSPGFPPSPTPTSPALAASPSAFARKGLTSWLVTTTATLNLWASLLIALVSIVITSFPRGWLVAKSLYSSRLGESTRTTFGTGLPCFSKKPKLSTIPWKRAAREAASVTLVTLTFCKIFGTDSTASVESRRLKCPSTCLESLTSLSEEKLPFDVMYTTW